MFNEANAVEEFLLSRMTSLGWTYGYGPKLVRTSNDAMLEPSVRAALLRLNADVASQPDRADEVIYKLRGVILGVAGDGLVRANEEFMAWVRGDRTMPFGPDGEHVTIRLVDFDDISTNEFVVANQVVCTMGPEKM